MTIVSQRPQGGRFPAAAAILFVLTIAAQATNWYVKPSSSGSNDGSSWTNAWSASSLNSNWSRVQPGDTVWLAGGTYSTGIQFIQSGSLASRISVKRVLSTDSSPISSAGWDRAFDSQVIIAPPSAPPLLWPNGNGAGSYVTVDGRVAQGIVAHQANVSNGDASISLNGGGQHDITLANIDAYVSLNAHGTTFAGDLTSWQAVNANNVLTQNCLIHGSVTVTKLLYGCTNCTFDHCTFYDSDNLGTSHPNLFEVNTSPGPITFSSCVFTDWAVEGFMMWNTVGTVNFIGCLMHNPSTRVGSASFLWPSGTGESTAGPVHLYDNTFVNVPITTRQGNSVNFAAGSQARNNIYWSSSFGFPVINDDDFNFSNGNSPGGANSINNGSNPFVDLSGKNYHLSADTGTTFPRNKGVALDAQYKADPDGNTRGADGAWDIGAYEYTGTNLPLAPQNLRLSVINP